MESKFNPAELMPLDMGFELFKVFEMLIYAQHGGAESPLSIPIELKRHLCEEKYIILDGTKRSLTGLLLERSVKGVVYSSVGQITNAVAKRNFLRAEESVEEAKKQGIHCLTDLLRTEEFRDELNFYRNTCNEGRYRLPDKWLIEGIKIVDSFLLKEGVK